jgi:hypothetical protein
VAGGVELRAGEPGRGQRGAREGGQLVKAGRAEARATATALCAEHVDEGLPYWLVRADRLDAMLTSHRAKALG